jgi:hypothetical protein
VLAFVSYRGWNSVLLRRSRSVERYHGLRRRKSHHLTSMTVLATPTKVSTMCQTWGCQASYSTAKMLKQLPSEIILRSTDQGSRLGLVKVSPNCHVDWQPTNELHRPLVGHSNLARSRQCLLDSISGLVGDAVHKHGPESENMTHPHSFTYDERRESSRIKQKALHTSHLIHYIRQATSSFQRRRDKRSLLMTHFYSYFNEEKQRITNPLAVIETATTTKDNNNCLEGKT